MKLIIKLIAFHFLFNAAYALSEPLNDVFIGERKIYDASLEIKNLPIALGTLKKVNARWITEKEIIAKGEVSKQTFELSSRYSAQLALNTLSQAIKGYENRLLFACDGLNCGSSNAWANERFNLKTLYGKDQTQAYRVWEITIENNRFLVVTYTVMRGNRKVYAHIETIKLEERHQSDLLISSARAILERFDDYGFFELPASRFGIATPNTTIQTQKEISAVIEGVTVSFNAEQLTALINAFKLKPFLKFTIVGHDYSIGSDEQERQKRSLIYANALKHILEEQGIKSSRFNVKALGGLAPTNTEQKAKLVLIKN